MESQKPAEITPQERENQAAEELKQLMERYDVVVEGRYDVEDVGGLLMIRKGLRVRAK